MAGTMLPRTAFTLPRALAAAVALLLCFSLRGGARADEGQWLPEQLADLDFSALEKRGLEMTAKQIWDGEKGLLTAAVQISGCSASFVSKDGLIVTNHHCGFGAINAASTVERNLLEDGFVSATRADEIPAPGYTVSFVRGYEDVTAEIHAAAAAAGEDPAAQWRAVQQERRRLEDEAKSEFESAIVVSYFEGREWRRIRRTVLADVRLVYAPPRDVGEYGGETDNWMWPRHTGDFSFFRAYVAPDGSPSAYSPDNVPYEAPRWLEVSTAGVEESDLVMVLGYPGRTNRYATSVAVEAAEALLYPLRHRVYSEIIRLIEADAAGDAEKELRNASRIKSLANVMKNAAGQVWGLERNRVVERKLEEEAAISKWIRADRALAKKFDGVLESLLELDRADAARVQRDFLLGSLNGALRGGKPEGADLAIAEMLLAEFARLPEGQQPAELTAWADGGRAGGFEALAKALEAPLSEMSDWRDTTAGRRMDVAARWIEAQEQWRGKRFYPDANSTLRVSVASVKGYEPRDGVMHLPFTTVDGMLRKHTGEGDFDVPDAVMAAVEKNPAARNLRVCFLSDADTTGGNSGSPVVDGKGRLVGLNFDRVFENVAGDFGWNPERSRNVIVDIRYVLWLMKDVWPAPALLKEMGVK